jgi:NitT/TauT family transport system permease protein
MHNLNGKKKFLKDLLCVYVSLSLLILTWEFSVYIFKISPVVLVRPSEIYPIIFERSDILLKALTFTFTEIFWGWMFGSLLGFVIAIFIYNFNILKGFVSSTAVLINAMPIITLVAIIGNFFGTGQDSKIIITAFICFFPMFIGALAGLSSANDTQNDLLKTYSANKLQKLFVLDLPTALPGIIKALEINVISAIFAAVVSEFFGAHGGIGAFILAHRGLYNLPLVWAAIFYLIIMGTVFYFVVSVIGKLMIPWHKDQIA